MNELEKALEYWAGVDDPNLSPLLDAARRFANLTSPETIDVLNVRLHHLVEVQEPCKTACTHLLWGDWTALGLANILGRAVLRSVEEGGKT